MALTNKDEDPSFDLSDKHGDMFCCNMLTAFALRALKNRVIKGNNWSLVYSFSRFHHDDVMVVVPKVASTTKPSTDCVAICEGPWM